MRLHNSIFSSLVGCFFPKIICKMLLSHGIRHILINTVTVFHGEAKKRLDFDKNDTKRTEQKTMYVNCIKLTCRRHSLHQTTNILIN